MPPEGAASLRAAPRNLLALVTGQARDGARHAAETPVEGDERSGVSARLQVYAHVQRARITDAMGVQFPRLTTCLGPERMAELAVEYLAEHSSEHPTLRSVGDQLPAWLERRRAESPWLADLARLEWARADLADAANESPLTLGEVHGQPPKAFADLPLRLITAHRMVTVDYAIAAFWDAIRDGQPVAAADDATDGCGESLLVWRQGGGVVHRVIDETERAVLARVARGTTFNVVREALLRSRSRDAATDQAFAWLSSWLADELLLAPGV